MFLCVFNRTLNTLRTPQSLKVSLPHVSYEDERPLQGEHFGETVVTCGLVVEQRKYHQITCEPMKFLAMAEMTGQDKNDLRLVTGFPVRGAAGAAVVVRLARSQTESQMPLRFLRLMSSKRSHTTEGEALRRHAGLIPRPAFRRHSGRLEDLRREVTKAVTKLNGARSTPELAFEPVRLLVLTDLHFH